MLQVLYNLFQWPLLKASRLAVIGISNTHDLPDKFLPRIARCAAALAGITVLCFAPLAPQLLASNATHFCTGKYWVSISPCVR